MSFFTSGFDFSTSYGGQIFLFIAFFCAVLLSTGLLNGWFFFVDILERNQVYHWLCDDRSNPEPCPQQKASIQFLLSYGQLGQFSCHIIAATLKDLIGFKRLAMIGFVLYYTGFTLFVSSSEKFQAYIPGFIIMNAANDFAYYPALSLTGTVPKRANLVMSFFLGASFMASFVPAILNEVDKRTSISFSTGSLIYLYGISMPVFIVYLFLLPHWKFKQTAIIQELNKSKTSQANDNGHPKPDPMVRSKNFENPSSINNSIAHSNSNINNDIHIIDIEGSDKKTTNSENENSTSVTSSPLIAKIESLNPTPSTASHDHLKIFARDTNSNSEFSNNSENSKPITGKDSTTLNENPAKKINRTVKIIKKVFHPQLLRAATSISFALFFIYWSVHMIRFTFFQNSARDILGVDISLILGYTNPIFTPLFCLFYGLLYDRFGFTFGALIMNFTCTLLHICLLICALYPTSVIRWLPIIIFPMTLGNTILLFCYNRENFSHIPFYAMLNGIGFIIAVVMSYISSGLYFVTVQHLNDNFTYVTSMIVTISILLTPYLLLKDRVNKRVRNNRKTDPSFAVNTIIS